MRKRTVQWLCGIVAATGLVAAGFGLGTVLATPDLYDQTVFPCAEDEALMYSQVFGSDKVGCVPAEYLVPNGTGGRD